MKPRVGQFVNLDADASVFFARQLEFIKARTYDVIYPEYKAQRLIPVSTEAGAGAETITYRQFDTVGVMKIISNYADDLPRCDVRAAEFYTPVKSIGASYGYNVQEIRAAQFANRPLQQMKADACRRAYEQAVNKIAWFARPGDKQWGGLTGLFYQPNITIANTKNNKNWLTSASPDEIIDDLNAIVANMLELTKGVEIPDTILLPVKHYAKIATTPRSNISDTTILEFFLRNNPSITRVEWLNECKDVQPKPSTPTVPSSKADIMVAFRSDPMKLTLEIPQPFEQFPAQERGLEYIVPTHARIGGVIAYYPLSIAINELA